MRIIGGQFKGHRFNPPADKWPTRPTTDYSKEALFNILDNRIDYNNIKMLDLFGGTGNHCYEFISRGCIDATYVDQFRPAVAFVQKISEKLKIEDKIAVVRSDVFKFLKQNKNSFDYIFAGPPYGLKSLDTIPDVIFSATILDQNGLFVLEHNQNHNFTSHPNFVEVRNYGQTHFCFFKHLNS